MGNILLFVAWMGSLSASAGEISPDLRRLQKCYGIMVGERINKSDPLYVAVAGGSLSGTDACMSIFDRARLGANGRIPSVNGVPDPVGNKVLSNFLEFHRTNIQAPDFFVNSGSSFNSEVDVFDTNESALHFVYSLFKPGEPYSNVVKRGHGVRALRYTARTAPRVRPVAAGNMQFMQGPNGSTVPLNPTLIEVGQLAGMVPDTVRNQVDSLETNNAAFQGSSTNLHFGGGFMGSQSYINAVYGTNFRIWSRNLLSDAMCRDLPVLRTIDVVSAVKPESTFAWRKGLSCMQCHETMDPLTGAIRNQMRIRTAPQNGIVFWVSRTVDRPSAPYPSINVDPDFARRPADFSLKYRSFDGTLVDVSATGLSALGNALAERDDLYVCASKRYFQLFTGIDVDVRDGGDPLNPLDLSPSEQKLRERVIQWGRQLKQDQDARELIKRIISSPVFIYPDRGI